MIMAFSKIIPTKEWHHDPKLQDDFYWTVAMHLARNKIIPPKEWHHDPSL